MTTPFRTLSHSEAQILEALFERFYPADESGVGAREIGVINYLDQTLAGHSIDLRETYRIGVQGVNRTCHQLFGKSLMECDNAQMDTVIGLLQRGELPGESDWNQSEFFALLRQHCIEGLFGDPIHGGNRDMLGWKSIGHPGVWLENSAEEQLATKPVTKNGKYQSIADVQLPRTALPAEEILQAGARFNGEVDVVLVGVGGVGGVIAPMLAGAGLRVVGLEAGPYWQTTDFAPDEVSAAYYCRAGLSGKFALEAPVWRRHAGDPVQPATYSLGRMINGVGGSIIHYGAWLRRFHPHHLRFRSHIVERWGERVIPSGCTIADWPVSYDELEPWFIQLEQLIGIAGDEDNPFITRSQPLPLPPTRPFRMGETFREAARTLGFHPFTTPVSITTAPYNGLPETTYCTWNGGFGAWDGDKWHPGLTSVPAALATGNFELRTHCRVLRVLTDADGRARGVEYLDRSGQLRTQMASVVILAAYTFENVRLLFLSADDMHPEGLGNNTGQLGRHFMSKMFTHVDGHVPEMVFNRHAGPASQAVVFDDLVSAEFDPVAAGRFIGGGTLGSENQFLPIMIARETLPPGVPEWGTEYRNHLTQWQHWAVVRTQPDTQPYEFHTIDLDPVVKDRSGLGLPVVRLTFDLQENEHRQATYLEKQSENILRQMGATQTWHGPRFTGVGSSHDLGGCRMADDPAAGVVGRDLQVHDTPGLYVFSGAALPTCPGLNPTLTIWAVCCRAAEALVQRLQRGEPV